VLPETLSRSERGRKTGTAIVERARKFMNERHGESLTNEMIVRHVGCSPSYLVHAFRSAFGLTPGKHLRDIRVGAGLELLRTTVLSIENVSQ
jgi:AraC-like DNA-binding protein